MVTQNSSIDKITPAGVVSIFASNVANANEAAGMAFDSSGDLYLAASNSVEKFTPGGTASTFYGYPSGRTLGLAIDSFGNVYVGVGSGGGGGGPRDSVEEITPGGIASAFVSGLYGISSLAFDSANNLYVADGYSANNGDPNTLLKFTPSGVESALVGSPSNPISSLAFAPSAVPEPSSLVMLGMGAVGILGYLRRKSNKADR